MKKNGHILKPEYLYFNDGKKRRQLKCKVCSSLSQMHPHHRNKTGYFCPYCDRPLYLWKERKEVSIYKCGNNRCPHFLKSRSKLNLAERLLVKIKSSQFKLRYLKIVRGLCPLNPPFVPMETLILFNLLLSNLLTPHLVSKFQ